MTQAEPSIEETDLGRTMDLLGGAQIFRGKMRNRLDTHDLLHEGLPAGALEHLVGGVGLLKRDDVLERALGISERTYYRRKKDEQARPLSREQSGRIWKFAEILTRATTLLGSQEAAERWLEEPCIGLNQRRPIDLLSTPAGVETVETYLMRMDYGVYA